MTTEQTSTFVRRPHDHLGALFITRRTAKEAKVETVERECECLTSTDAVGIPYTSRGTPDTDGPRRSPAPALPAIKNKSNKNYEMLTALLEIERNQKSVINCRVKLLFRLPQYAVASEREVRKRVTISESFLFFSCCCCCCYFFVTDRTVMAATAMNHRLVSLTQGEDYYFHRDDTQTHPSSLSLSSLSLSLSL